MCGCSCCPIFINSKLRINWTKKKTVLKNRHAIRLMFKITENYYEIDCCFVLQHQPKSTARPDWGEFFIIKWVWQTWFEIVSICVLCGVTMSHLEQLKSLKCETNKKDRWIFARGNFIIWIAKAAPHGDTQCENVRNVYWDAFARGKSGVHLLYITIKCTLI